jgi:transcriptional regulator with XRE-family HTH domain
MPDEQRPTLRSRRLGMELRRIRESLGYNTHAAARLLNRTQSSISKLETGHRGIRVPALLQILDTYGVTDPDRRAALVRLAKDARKTGWWQSYEMLSPEDMDLIGLEAEACEIRYFELILVPGLLQIEAYIRALLSRGPFAGDQALIDQLVAVRLQRAEVLTHSDPPTLQVVVDEAALHRRVGGRDVMDAQFKHLLEMCELPNVEFQVLPFASGAHSGVAGAFIVLTVGDSGNWKVVAIDSLTEMSYREDEAQIAAYESSYTLLRAAALTQRDSQRLVERLRSEL